jgi:hypothetical protein
MLQHFSDCITLPKLTERETEVRGLLATGRDNAGVARRLGGQHQDGASPRIQHHHHSCTLRRVRSHSFGTRRRVGRNYPCPLGAKKLECHHR